MRSFLFVGVFVGVLLLIGFGLSGCAVRTAATNSKENVDLILERVHLDTQEVINHPQRWLPAVESLCSDGLLRADECVKLRAYLRARAILVGDGEKPESRLWSWGVDGEELQRRFLDSPAKDKSLDSSLPGGS